MFAVVQLPTFPLQALLRFQPALRTEPVAVLDGEGRRATVAYVNDRASGIAPGMTAAQALAECPAAQLVTRSFIAEREASALLLAASWALSPTVEPSGPDRCTVDLSGANFGKVREQTRLLHAHLAAHGLTPRIGVGQNPLIARYAAHLATPELWVEHELSFLAPLPLSLLPLNAEEASLFADLGLSTLGALTAFPRAALASRLGARGAELWALAAGEWSGAIHPAPFPSRFIAEMELEEPVETLEPLLFALRRFTERLASEVGQLGQGTSRLALILRLESDQTYSRDFELPEPTGKADVLFGVLENHLSALQTDAPIIGFLLEAFPAHRLEQQTGIFDTGLSDAPAFFATLGRLAAVVGNENVGTPRHADTHRPDAFQLVSPATSIPSRIPPAAPRPSGPLLRRLRPPQPATVEIASARPTFLHSAVVTGDVIILRRPFWSSGDWFNAEEWNREEWDVRIGAGLYRLLHEPHGWFVEGIYD